jgi:hypothetical protein
MKKSVPHRPLPSCSAHVCVCPLFPGEAVGLALGLVMLGSKSAQAIEDMVGYAQETQHEKILRGLAVGIAMVMYGCMEEAHAHREPLQRHGNSHTHTLFFHYAW